jgi:CBS domain-containing protein
MDVSSSLERLREIAARLVKGESVASVTVREFLGWFDAQRRGVHIVEEIRSALADAKLVTEPDFEGEWIDGNFDFKLRGPDRTLATADKTGAVLDAAVVSRSVALSADVYVATAADPTYRIGKLNAANNPKLVSVSLDSPVAEAVLQMMRFDYSQLPVMQGEREVKGVVSWRSIGRHLALGNAPDRVAACMEPHHHIVNASDSLFAVIDLIVLHQYVLVRGDRNRITGIVTSSDLSLQFRQLAGPFLLIGEIENHVRGIINEHFSVDELKQAIDERDKERPVHSVADLTLGEFTRLLEEPGRWSRVKLRLDRKEFVKLLDQVRQIRNDVMHFDPDGIGEYDSETLTQCARLLQGIRETLRPGS